MRRVFLAILLLSTLIFAACSETGFIIDNLRGENSDDVCIPRYDVNGNDLNNCSTDEREDDNLSDLDDLLKEIEKDLEKNNEEIVEEDLSQDEVIESIVEREDSGLVKTVVEGELVELKPRVNDPDGDDIVIRFSEPLDENGMWYTQEGDAGEYLITVSADDGRSVSEQTLKLIVLELNKAPEIEISSELRFNEGDTVLLEPNVVDPEGEDVTVSYSGWMNSNVKETDFGDSGVYTVLITATDGDKSSSKEVQIILEEVNRAPEFESLPRISVDEGDLVVVNPVVSDPDGDVVTLNFEEPLNSDGRWQTQEGDAGEYEFTVVASDGDLETSIIARVRVESSNKAPVLQRIDDIYVKEGEVVEINPVAIDPEGEELTFTYSGWMTSNTYETNFDDQGEHIVTVSVSDGVNTASIDVNVIVEDVNRAPVITCFKFFLIFLFYINKLNKYVKDIYKNEKRYNKI